MGLLLQERFQQPAYFTLFSMPLEFLLGKNQLSVHHELESPAITRDQGKGFDLRTVFG